MFRRPTRSTRQLILTCLALLLASCAGPPPAELVDVPHPALDQTDEAVQQQIAAARARLEAAQSADAPAAEVAGAMGELGNLYQGYDFDEAALASYWNAVALTPQEFRWLYYLGALEIGAGKLEDGKRHLEAALDIRPEDLSTLLRLGRAALDEADHEAATDLYTRASEAEPGCAAAHFGLGLAALGAGDNDRAVLAFQQTLDLDPGASQTHRPLAMAYRALGETALATQELAQAGTAMPSCPDPLMAEIQQEVRGASALFERATLADLEGRSKAALDLVEQAVSADPKHAAARRLYGQLLTHAGEVEKALDQLQAAAELEPEDRRTYLLLGRAHRTRGSLQDSAAALAQAIELDPQYSRARVELALTQIERERWGEARAVLEQGLELDPSDLDLRVQLARTLAAEGDLGRSRRELDAVLEQDPRHAVAHLALGAMDLEAEAPSAAESHLLAVLEGEASSATYALAHYHLARLAAGREDEAMTRRHLETAVTLAPTLVAAQLALGELEIAQGRTSQASRIYSQAATLRPDLPQPRAGEARALLFSGRHLDARRKLEAANREFPRDPEIAHLLARVLATAPAPRVRDGQRALELATGLFADQKTLEYGETVAMALAELERYDEAVEWQLRLLEQARQAEEEVDPEVFDRLEAHLADYQNGRPARDAW